MATKRILENQVAEAVRESKLSKSVMKPYPGKRHRLRAATGLLLAVLLLLPTQTRQATFKEAACRSAPPQESTVVVPVHRMS